MPSVRIKIEALSNGALKLTLYNVKVVDGEKCWTIEKLDPGRFETFKISGEWEYGQQVNTATATAEAHYGLGTIDNGDKKEGSAVDYKKYVSDTDVANYYGINGTLEACFWNCKYGKSMWDGKNPKKGPKTDLLQDTNNDAKLDGLRIGDLNYNGKHDNGECTLVYSRKDAAKS